MKSKYTKQYLFRKQNENVALLSDEISFGVIDTSLPNAMRIMAGIEQSSFLLQVRLCVIGDNSLEI